MGGGKHGPLTVSSIFLGFCYRELAKKFGKGGLVDRRLSILVL